MHICIYVYVISRSLVCWIFSRGSHVGGSTVAVNRSGLNSEGGSALCASCYGRPENEDPLTGAVRILADFCRNC